MLLARSTGGVGTHVADLTRELCALGHEVRIATDDLTATTFGWDDAHRIWPATGTQVPQAVRAVRDLARGADVVHAHGHQAGSFAAVALRSLPRRQRPSLAVSLHNAVLGGHRRRLLGAVTAQPFARGAQLVTGASSDLVEQARRWGADWAELAPVPSPKVPDLLALPSPDQQERRESAANLLAGAGLPASPGTDLVVSIARIAPQKDLPTMVAAAAAGRHRRAVWVVIGGGDHDLLAALRAQADDHDAPIHFIGAQDDPLPWLRAASSFVLTSHWEARALVVQEAMAAGTPVIARDTGGLRDLVESVGILIDTDDPRVWADALGELLDGPGAWHTASAAGRTRAASWPDSAATATRWVQWYADLARMT